MNLTGADVAPGDRVLSAHFTAKKLSLSDGHLHKVRNSPLPAKLFGSKCEACEVYEWTGLPTCWGAVSTGARRAAAGRTAPARKVRRCVLPEGSVA